MLGLGNSITSGEYSESAYAVTRSVQLDGADDHIIINHAVANNIKNVGSMSIWLKNTDASGNDTIFNLHTGTSNDNKIAILFINQGGNEVIRFNSRGSSTNTLLDHPYAVELQDGDGSPAWIHFVATWSRTANTMAMYINGSKVQTSTSAMADYATTADTIYIGKPGNSNNAFFKGNFSSLSLFDVTISDATVTTLYNSGSANLDVGKAGIDGLVAFLPLDETSGNFIDRTESGAEAVPSKT